VTGIEPAWPAWKGGPLNQELPIKFLVRSQIFEFIFAPMRSWALYGHHVCVTRFLLKISQILQFGKGKDASRSFFMGHTLANLHGRSEQCP
jgi:hypothetical protein